MVPSYPTVLAYHRLSRIPLPAGTWVSPQVLGRQMDLLLEAGLLFADPQEWSPADHQEILLTFDDGTIDLVELGGVLARRQLRGMIFIPSRYLGRTNDWEWSIPGRNTYHLNARQLILLSELGWEIGLHGASHTDLTRMEPTQLADEISLGRQVLSELLGRSVRYFSYPFGRCNDFVKTRIEEEGFEAAFVMAGNHTGVLDPMAIARRPVYCIDTAGDVLAKVLDPAGHSLQGRWQIVKERSAHGVGRFTAGWIK